jgi:NitT/TauT family transport system substrate-binding protein
MRKVRLVVIAVTLFLAGCGANPTTQPKPVTLAMGYIPNVQFAPIYVAVKKGYFAAEGVEVQFDYGFDTDLLKLVGTDEIQFAVGSGDQVILARSQGLPVVYVMDWYHRFPVSVVALAEKNISRPEDLIGKKVGTPVMYGASYVGWRALLYATGVDPTRVTLQTIGYAQVPALVQKQVDAAVCYSVNEPVQLRQSGYQVTTIDVSQYIDLVSNGIITNDKTVAGNPKLVQGMIRAALKGLAYTLDNPDEAFSVAREYIPEMKDADAPLQREVLTACVDLWSTDKLGESDAAAWQHSVDFMASVGMIQSSPKVQELYTNRFVEGAH